MSKTVDFKKYVVAAECMPQTAASLILGLAPDACLRKSEREWREVTILVQEVQCINDTLCGGSKLWWNYSHFNIFYHVNTAIQNQIEIAAGLLTAISQFYSNLLSEDKEKFVQHYPYVARECDLKVDAIKTAKSPDIISEKERPQLLKILLGMSMHAYGYKPGQRNAATGSKHGSIRAALASVGLDVDEDTIRKYLNESHQYLSDT